ncbi:hypothetical protein B0H14DRAFT_2608716 [Mycena olivaceomarginata]|nr:hypothetical protein B0H14DRAFT_2608716 [Mycena olivaceomarginata]
MYPHAKVTCKLDQKIGRFASQALRKGAPSPRRSIGGSAKTNQPEGDWINIELIDDIRRSFFFAISVALAAMSGLPDFLKIPDGPEKLSLPPTNLPVTSLIKFQLPPQRKSTVFADPSDYLSDLPPTTTAFNVAEIMSLGRAILLDPEVKSIVLVHSPAHRGKDDRYLPWLATIWSLLERVREAKILWCTALDPVHETLRKSTTSTAFAGYIKTALEALDGLPWDNWLKTDHEDQMLELLASDLGISDGNTSCVEPTYFVQTAAVEEENSPSGSEYSEHEDDSSKAESETAPRAIQPTSFLGSLPTPLLIFIHPWRRTSFRG